MRGPITTAGYHKRPDATAPCSTTTAGCTAATSAPLDDDGFLSIVDRKKELIITCAGKNVAPSNIESLLKESPIVGHALAFGDNRPYVVAVLTLDGEVAPVVAQMQGIEFTDLADLAEKPEILAMAQDAVDRANARLSRPEQVKSLRAAAGRVDRGVRGADPDAEAEATRRARQVRRRDRRPVRRLTAYQHPTLRPGRTRAHCHSMRPLISPRLRLRARAGRRRPAAAPVHHASTTRWGRWRRSPAPGRARASTRSGARTSRRATRTASWSST